MSDSGSIVMALAVAVVISIPHYLAWWETRKKLDKVHELVNSQSEKLNTALRQEAFRAGVESERNKGEIA